jgi:hypothetical protein
MVAASTGLSSADAEKQVSDTLSEARRDLDEARRVTARVLLWTFLALIIGAFLRQLCFHSGWPAARPSTSPLEIVDYAIRYPLFSRRADSVHHPYRIVHSSLLNAPPPRT